MSWKGDSSTDFELGTYYITLFLSYLAEILYSNLVKVLSYRVAISPAPYATALKYIRQFVVNQNNFNLLLKKFYWFFAAQHSEANEL